MAAPYRILDALVDRGLLRILKPSELAVLTCLMRHMNHRSQRAWPSRKRIANATGLHAGTVSEAIQRLVTRRLIRVSTEERMGKFRGYRIEVFSLTPPDVWLTHDVSEIPTSTSVDYTSEIPQPPQSPAGTTTRKFHENASPYGESEMAETPATTVFSRHQQLIGNSEEKEQGRRAGYRLRLFRTLKALRTEDLRSIINVWQQGKTADHCGWPRGLLKQKLEQYVSARVTAGIEGREGIHQFLHFGKIPMRGGGGP